MRNCNVFSFVEKPCGLNQLFVLQNVERRPIDRARFPYRMKDLCDRTGLPRQVIHFYIQQGLLPEGQKTGRNMA